MKLSPKKPSTIVGTPAIVSSAGLTMVRTRVEANSDRRTAARSPSGTAMSSPIPATRSVPEMSARTPHACGLMSADQREPVKNSIGLTWRKNSNVSRARTVMIPTVVSTPTAAARKSRRSITRSLSGRRWVSDVVPAVIRWWGPFAASGTD